MTLPFSTTWPDRMGDLAGQPSYFIGKIWKGICNNMGGSALQMVGYSIHHIEKFGHSWDSTDIPLAPKLHTMRDDPNNRWRPGMKIHPVINNRSKDRFQFAPVLECKGVQKIEICYHNMDSDYPTVTIDKRKYFIFDMAGRSVLEKLAVNDGFPSVEAFFMWFNKDFKGEIIHWTDLRY